MALTKLSLVPLYTKADESRVLPVLDALRQRKIPVSDNGESPKAGGIVLFFLSANLQDDPPVINRFLLLDSGKSEIIPVNLDGSAPPDLIGNAMMAKNTIFAERYSVEELADRIAGAAKKPAKAVSRTRNIIIVAAAAIVLAGVGILLWRIIPRGTGEPKTDNTTAPVHIPDGLGISAEELEQIRNLIIIGDKLYYFNGTEEWVAEAGLARVGAEQYATRTEEDLIAHWYSKEDGHEIEMAAWDDLDFFRYMKNVRFITLVRASCELPDLSGLEQLSHIELMDCDISNIDALKNARMYSFRYSGSTLSDFSPLLSCSRLERANLTLYAPIPEDLSSFGPPNLTELFIDSDSTAASIDLSGLKNCQKLSKATLDSLPITDLSCLTDCKKLNELELINLPELMSVRGLEGHTSLRRLFVDHETVGLADMSALSDNTSLKYADLHAPALSDLSWLANAKNIEELDLWQAHGLTSLHGLEEHTALRRLHVEQAEQLNDITALRSCTELREILLAEVFGLSDISPVVKLPKLTDLEIYGSRLDDVDFLYDITNKDGFSFGIAEVRDWSGLEAIDHYDFLNVTDRTGSALPYLRNASVRRFELWCRSGISDWSREPFDWSQFPSVTEDLMLHGVVSFEGMPELPITGLFIDDSQMLTSLSGIQNLANTETNLLRIHVKGCPRLTDWSALNGMKLAGISFENTFSLPDFAAIETNFIGLEAPVDLYDLHCFDGMDPDRNVSIELFQTMDVTDLSPLYALKNGEMLQVPAHLQEQARLLTESGNFREFEVVYPDEWWEPAEFNIQLLSLDELDTLPEAVLKRINQLNMAGDVIFSQDEYDLDQIWEEDEPAFVLRSRDGDESHDIVIERPGTLPDFSRLSVLTGLEHLRLVNQSFTSIDGIQNLQELKNLEITFTPTLSDASPAFTLQELQELSLEYSGVTDIHGIQNLRNLEFLNLNGLKLADLAPLGSLPEDCNFVFEFPLMTFEEFLALPDSVLSRIREIGFFGNYVMKDPWGDLWFEEDWDEESPDHFIHDNTADTRIPIGQGPITDLGFLNRLPNLEHLHLYAQPIDSLNGIESAKNLRRFNSRRTGISDLTPLYKLPQLENISVENTATLTSIDGIEQLEHLTCLNIGGTGVSDLSFIKEIDYTYCMTPDEEGNVSGFDLGVDNLQGTLPDEQYALLSSVPYYHSLNVFNTDCSLFIGVLKDTPISEIHAGGCHFSNESFRQFIEEHPELEYIKVSWTPELTDISPLRNLSGLRAACVSHDMTEATDSLGDEYGFDLEIE